MDDRARSELETARLLLRRWRASDYPAFKAYYGDLRTARFVGGVMSPERAWRHLAALIGHWELRGFGYWALEARETGAFVGCAGLWRSEGWPELELGYWLTSSAQGRGYATEAGRAALAFAYETLQVETLVSYIDPENAPSRRVAERLGAAFENEIDLLDYGRHCVYRHVKPRA